MLFKEINNENLNEAVKIFKDSFNAAPWFEKWTEETASKRLGQIINFEGGYGLIAHDGENNLAMIVGHEEYYYDGTRFNIKEFCVNDNFKGQGIGSKVLEEFVSRLKDRGIVQMSLYTLKEEKTLKFYVKNGFKEIENLVMMENV